MKTLEYTKLRRGGSSALLLLSAVQLIVILDVSIVNIALPSIGRELSAAPHLLQWVVTAYGLVLGGFLLVGGRLSDLAGRRRILLGGIALFTISSLAGGLAGTLSVLVLTRGLQGLGAALAAPAALAMLSTLFDEGPERNRALAVWAAAGSVGAVAGTVLGGALTSEFGWRWVFFVNVPIGLALMAASARLLPESRAATTGKRLDLAGGVSVTAGLLLLVFGVNQAVESGWGSSDVLLPVGAAAALLGGFVAIESRSGSPLVPLGIFRRRTVASANLISILVSGAMLSLFYVMTLYMQQVLGYSPLVAGIAYLPMPLTIAISAAVAARAVTRFGHRAVLATGSALIATAMLFFSRAPVEGSYAAILLPGFVIAAAGYGLSLVSVQAAAFSGVRPEEAGLASGLINTTLEIGGAMMIALLATVAATTTRTLSGVADSRAALAGGFSDAFMVSAWVALAGLFLALTLLRERKATPKGHDVWRTAVDAPDYETSRLGG